MSALVALQLNDQFLTIFGLQKATPAPNANPTYVVDATGTVNIYDSGGNLVAGPVSFVYVPGPLVMANGATSPGGNYQAQLSHTFDPAVGVTYTTKIDLTSPTYGVFHVEAPTTVAINRGP